MDRLSREDYRGGQAIITGRACAAGNKAWKEAYGAMGRDGVILVFSQVIQFHC